MLKDSDKRKKTIKIFIQLVARVTFGAYQSGQSGVTLVEGLMAIAGIGFATMLALNIFSSTVDQNSRVNVAESAALVRIGVYNLLSTDYLWKSVIRNNTTEFACIGQSPPNDCRGHSGSFSIFDTNDTLLYDPAAGGGTSGFNLSGEVCNNFDSANGNSACPFHVDLIWRAYCPPNPPAPATAIACPYPELQVEAAFQVRAGINQSVAFNAQKFNFTLNRYGGALCPNQAGINLVTQVAGVLVTPGSFTSAVSSSSTGYPTGVAITSAPLVMCRTNIITFTQSIFFSGGKTVADADNRSDICIFDAGDDPNSPSCIYEWAHAQGTWTLLNRGTVVYTQAATRPFDTNTVFSFKMVNGLVKFYQGAKLLYVFTEIHQAPMYIEFTPGPTNASPQGLYNVSFSSSGP